MTDEKQKLVDEVIEELKEQFSFGDYTVLDEFLSFVPFHLLRGGLDESKWPAFPTPPDEEKNEASLKSDLLQLARQIVLAEENDEEIPSDIVAGAKEAIQKSGLNLICIKRYGSYDAD